MTPEQANELCDAFRSRFGGEAETEPVNGHGRYRFALVSDRFSGVPQLTRQDEAWKFVDDTLPREAGLDISLILIFAPAELAAAEEENPT